MNDVLDHAGDHHDLLDDFLDLDHAGNLYQLLDDLLHHDADLLYDLFLEDNRHWDLADDLHWDLFTVRYEFLHLYGYDLRFVLYIGDHHLNLHGLLLPQPHRHSLFDLNFPQFEYLPDNGFLHDPLHLPNDLLSISPRRHDNFLFIGHRDLLDNRYFMSHRNFNDFLLEFLCDDDLLDCLDDVDGLLDCVGYGDWDLLLDLDDLGHLYEVVHDLLELDVFGDLHGHLLSEPHLLDVGDVPEHLDQPLLVSRDLDNLLDNLGSLIGHLPGNLLGHLHQPLLIDDLLHLLIFGLYDGYFPDHIHLDRSLLCDDFFDNHLLLHGDLDDSLL